MLRRKKKSRDLSFSVRAKLWKCRNFIRNQPLVAALVFILSLLIAHRLFFPRALSSIIPPKSQFSQKQELRHENGVQNFVKKNVDPPDPKAIKAEKLWNDIQTEEATKTAGKPARVGPIELNAAS